MGFNDYRGARIGSSCKGCTERYEACHDTCEKYQSAAKEWKEYKEKVYQALKMTEYDRYAEQRRRKYDRKG